MQPSIDETTDPWVDAVREVASQERRHFDRHPTPDEILAYQAGELADETRRNVRRHLALCRSCTRSLLDLEAFPAVESPSGFAPGSDDRDRTWAAVAASLEDTGEQATPTGATTRASARHQLRHLRALAAILSVAVLGLGLWAASLRKQVAALTTPQANVLVHDLLPAVEGGTRSGAGIETVDLPPGTDRLVLILDIHDLRPFGKYRLDVAESNGTVRWRIDRLRRMPEGSFSVELPQAQHFLGEYRLDLYGSSDAEPVLLATYQMRVVRAVAR